MEGDSEKRRDIRIVTEDEEKTFQAVPLQKPKKSDTEGCQPADCKFRIAVVVLGVIIIVLIIAFVVAVILLVQQKNESSVCSSYDNDNINIEAPDTLPPFHDLTKDELLSVKNFLYKEPDLNLVEPADYFSLFQMSRSAIFSIELNVPDKDTVLNFLDNGGTAPVREAIAVIYRGDKSEPVVQEYIVGPLPEPTYKRSEKTMSFLHRPMSGLEFVVAVHIMKTQLHNKISYIFQESYGGNLAGHCTYKCLDFQAITPVTTGSTGEPKTRKIWFWLAPVVEYWSLHPLNFLVLMDVTSTDIDKFTIDKIYYGNQLFNPIDELKQAYDTGSVTKIKIDFPSVNKNLFSSMNRRGTLFPAEPQLPPREFEPTGKRYSINGRHITYMGWDFDVRMSTISGPQIFDIRYNNERIVYELSLQEIAVFYSSNSPALRFADYVDSHVLIGSQARSLVSGTDCPEHSTYIGTDVVPPGSEEPAHYDRSFCVFEHNTGVPLRRHLSFEDYKFYEGMMDIVLTVRTITSIANYDYILDFIFHQNGALEVKVVSTGYILTTLRYPAEDVYGFRLRDHLIGNIHHHMFHFKADMDIHGTQNRFETLEVVPVQVDNTQWSANSGATYSQTKMVRHEVNSEKEAAIKYNFETPKYLTFYSNKSLTASGVPRAYRLFTRGISKQMVEEGTGLEPSVSWARYQVAVTKYKEEERHSSSMYATWDAENPVVNFQSFIDDNETITDQDQVTWITMGIHHIPHMEDFPVTPTVGLDLGFFLLPYNYFDEDPAMGSGDAIRIEPRDREDIEKGLIVETYGKPEQNQCRPKQSTFLSDIKKNPKSIFG